MISVRANRIRVRAARGAYAKSRPRFYDRPSFTAAESNRNGGISNCNVIRGKSEREAGAGERRPGKAGEVVGG